MINRCRKLGQWLLHIPLFYKVVLTNSVVAAIGAVVGTVIATWHIRNSPDGYHYDLMAFFVVTGFVFSFAVNSLVIKAALTPLNRLQAALDDARRGKLDAQINAELISDARFDRLIATFNQMLDTLKQNAQQLHHLSQEILQAQEEERQRVARELHDEAAQTLTSLLVYLKLLEKSQNPEETQRIQNLRKLTAHALEEVRQVALELRPKILDDWGLEAALGWRVDELGAANSTKFTLQVIGIKDRLSRNLELAFYRVAQEALANIVRHAQARSARVVLKKEGDWLTLEVRDDGVGFDTATMQSGRPRGLGLLGMRERLALVGGELVIESQPGKGTRLAARAPLAQPVSNGVQYEKDSRLAG